MIYLLLLLLGAALAYQVLALVSLWRLFRQPLPGGLSPEAPGITVFKPVKGVVPDTRECLETFLRQSYPSYQVLFGVADPGDPVLPLLKALEAAAPPGQVEVVLCPGDLGHNPKVSILRHLEPRARFDLLVVADGDVRVGPDFLARAAAALKEPGVGLVSCPYRAGRTETLGARLEALTISADFIPSVAAARTVEGIRFALGAAMAFTREALRRLGGFAALADYLADDYQLGRRVHQAGLGVRLLPYVVETVNPRMSFTDYFGHQLRWSRTYRVCRPGGYLAYGLTHALIFALAVWGASGLAPWALGLVGAALTVRTLVALFSERLCLRGSLPAPAFLLLPVKDLLSFVLWLLSFLGHEVAWQGRPFHLTREGLLAPLEDKNPPRP